MSAAVTEAFLADLPVFAEFADVADPARYRALPEGWALGAADIVASGAAIAAGKYKSVNMAGAAVIAALLNGLGRRDLPFAFGGDGALVAVPPEGMVAAREALAAVGRWVEDELALDLRCALVPIADLRAAGREAQVARFRAGAGMDFAMFAGGGAAWADAEMKAGRYAVPRAAPGTRHDLTGLSCRWDPVPARQGQIVSVIAIPGRSGAGDAFRALVAEIVALAGGAGSGHPLPPEGPVPRLSFAGVEAEARALAPKGRRFRPRAAAMVQIVLSVLLHRTGATLGGFDARAYARELALNTDFRKFDDGLKMTVDLTDQGFAALDARLAAARAAGLCHYGLHRQDRALVTCIVFRPEGGDHMHFVDGASGGYAEAARRLKAQIAEG